MIPKTRQIYTYSKYFLNPINSKIALSQHIYIYYPCPLRKSEIVRQDKLEIHLAHGSYLLKKEAVHKMKTWDHLPWIQSFKRNTEGLNKKIK